MTTRKMSRSSISASVAKTSALDILTNSGSSTSNSIDYILDIGINRPSGNYNTESEQEFADKKVESLPQSSKMTHIDDQHCPKCHQPMTSAFIGQEEVFFCQKHAVTLPKSI